MLKYKMDCFVDKLLFFANAALKRKMDLSKLSSRDSFSYFQLGICMEI